MYKNNHITDRNNYNLNGRASQVVYVHSIDYPNRNPGWMLMHPCDYMRYTLPMLVALLFQLQSLIGRCDF